MFEQVNKAYEFLCSRSKVTEGPDPENIVLILKTQCILFARYKDGMFMFYDVSNSKVSLILNTVKPWTLDHP